MSRAGLVGQVGSRVRRVGPVDGTALLSGRRRGQFTAPESHSIWSFWPNGLYQATWSLPVTRGFLLEAGFSFACEGIDRPVRGQDVARLLEGGVAPQLDESPRRFPAVLHHRAETPRAAPGWGGYKICGLSRRGP